MKITKKKLAILIENFLNEGEFPTKELNNGIHIVQQGDTLQKIAKKYKDFNIIPIGGGLAPYQVLSHLNFGGRMYPTGENIHGGKANSSKRELKVGKEIALNHKAADMLYKTPVYLPGNPNYKEDQTEYHSYKLEKLLNSLKNTMGESYPKIKSMFNHLNKKNLMLCPNYEMDELVICSVESNPYSARNDYFKNDKNDNQMANIELSAEEEAAILDVIKSQKLDFDISESDDY